MNLSREEERVRAREEIDALQAELAQGRSGPGAAVLHHEIGRLYEEVLGDLRSAVTHYQAAFKEDPKHISTLQAARMIFAEKENWGMVFQLLDAEIRASAPGRTRASLLVAKGLVAADRLDNLGAAETAFTDALDDDPGNGRAYAALEAVLVRQGNWSALAETYARAAASTDEPARQAALLVSQAEVIEHRLGGVDGGAALYEQAATIDPTNTRARGALERLYYRLGRWKELANVLDQRADDARTRGDTEAEVSATYRLARVLAERLDDSEAARAVLEGVLESAPGELLCLTELSRLHEATESWERYVEVAIRMAAELVDRNELTALHARIAEVALEKLDDAELAVTQYEKAIALTPTYIPALQALGGLYARTKQWRKLVDMHIRDADESYDPRQQTVKYFKAAELEEDALDDQDRAIGYYKRALEATPGYLPAIKALDRLYSSHQRWDDLIAMYEREAQATSEPEQVNFLLRKIGSVYEERLGDIPQAIDTYERILSQSGGDLTAIRALGRLYDASGRWDDLVRINEMEAEQTIDQRRVVALLHKNGEIYEERLEQPEAAIACYQKVLKISPTYLPALQALGRLHYRAGAWAELVEMYRREAEVTRNPRHLAALLYKVGVLYDEKLGDPHAAADALRGALDSQPDDLPTLREFASMRRRQRDWEGYAELLEAEARTLVELNERTIALFRVGEIYEHRLEDAEAAADLYLEALRARAEFKPALEALERLYLANDRIAAAAELYRQRLDSGMLMPKEEADLRAKLGTLLAARMGDPSGGFEQLDLALSLDAHNPDLLRAAEPLAIRLGRWQRLAEIYETLAGTESGHAAAYLYLEAARLREERCGDPDGAIINYRRALELYPGHPVGLMALERLLRARGDDESLAEIYQQRIEASDHPAERASVAMRLGNLRRELGDEEGAAAAYELAVEAVPENLPALRVLRNTYESLGDLESMESTIARETEASKDPRAVAERHFLDAVRLLDQGDEGGARTELEKVLEIDPGHRGAGERLVEMLERNGDWDAVLKLLAERVNTVGRNADAAAMVHFKIGVVLRDRIGDGPAAIVAFNKVLHYDPDHVGALRSLADLYAAGDQWNETVSILAHAADAAQGPDAVELKLRLANIIAEELGDHAKAAAVLDALLATEKDHPVALLQLARLRVLEQSWEAAGKAYEKLAGMVRDSRTRAQALVGLAEVRQQLDDDAGAKAALDEARALAAADPELVERVGEYYRRTEQWDDLVALFEERAQALATEAPALAAKILLSAGRVLMDDVGRPAQAFKRFEDAIALDPGLVDARLMKAEALLAGRKKNKVAEAEEVYTSALNVAPFHPGALEGLATLRLNNKRPDGAWVAAQLALYVGGAGDGAREVVNKIESGVPQEPTGSLNDGAWADLRGDAVPPQAFDLMVAVDEHLAKLYPSDLDSHGVHEGEKLPAGDDDPARRVVDEAAEVLGIAAELDVYRGPGGEVRVENTTPPSVVVGEALLKDGLTAALRFRVARALAPVAGGWLTLSKLGGEEALRALAGFARWNVSDSPVPGMSGQQADELARRVNKSLPRKARKQVAGPAKAFAGVVKDLNPDAFGLALKEIACRVGVVACGNPAAAMGVLREEDPLPAGQVAEASTRGEQLAHNGLARRVASYILGDRGLKNRRAVGWAVKG